MVERETSNSRGRVLWEYALGILTESAYVISLAVVALVLIWLMLRWF